MLSGTDYWLLCGDVQRRRGNVKNSVMLVQSCIFPGRRSGGRGGGHSLTYIIWVCASPKRRVFLCRFGLKTGVDFAHFGLESGMVFEGTTEMYER